MGSPHSWMSFVVQNIPHPTVSDGLTHERSVGINNPRSAMLGVIYNLYPKTIYLKKMAESDIFKMTYFKRGTVVFDIPLSEFVSHIHYCIKLTSIRRRIPPNRLVHFNSLKSPFMGRCNELCNTLLTEMFVWGWRGTVGFWHKPVNKSSAYYI